MTMTEFAESLRNKKKFEIALLTKSEEKLWNKYLFSFYKGYVCFKMKNRDAVVIFKQKYLKRVEELEREIWKYEKGYFEVIDFVKIKKDYNKFKIEYLEDKLLETIEKYKKEAQYGWSYK